MYRSHPIGEKQGFGGIRSYDVDDIKTNYELALYSDCGHDAIIVVDHG